MQTDKPDALNCASSEGMGGGGEVTMQPALTEKIQLGKQSARIQNSIYVTSSRLVTTFSTSDEKLPVPETIPM